MVEVFNGSPHLPWGSFCSPYVDITTLSASTLTAQFPLAQLHLCRLLPYSSIQTVLLWEKEGEGLKMYPVLMETLWESSEEEHCLSLPCPLSVPFISSHSNRDMSVQTKEVLSFSFALRQLQEVKAKAQLEWRLALELEGLAKNYEDQWEVLAKSYEDQWCRVVQGQEDQWIRMAKQIDTTFREILSQMSQANSVRFLLSLLLQSMVLVPHAQWVKHSLPSPLQNLRAPQP